MSRLAADPNLSEAQKLASAAELKLAIENFQTAIALPGRAPADINGTFRTQAGASAA